MIYNSAHSNDYLWYLILRGKQKKRRNQNTLEYKFPLHCSNSRNNKNSPLKFIKFMQKISQLFLWRLKLRKLCFFVRIELCFREAYFPLMRPTRLLYSLDTKIQTGLFSALKKIV